MYVGEHPEILKGGVVGTEGEGRASTHKTCTNAMCVAQTGSIGLLPLLVNKIPLHPTPFVKTLIEADANVNQTCLVSLWE